MIELLPRVEKLENNMLVLSDLVKCHERDLYGEHELPGMAQQVEEMRKMVPVIKLWIAVLSFVATIAGGSLIMFIWALITHTVEIIH